MKVAYVSGGGSGIGRATARALAADGWRVVVLGRRAAPLEEVAKEVDGHAVAADLTDPAQAEAAVERAAELAGPHVDAIVTAAGGTSTLPDGTLAEIAAEWTDEFRLNVLTAVLLVEAAWPRLRTPGARIVNLSSIAAQRGGGSYGAAKAALHPGPGTSAPGSAPAAPPTWWPRASSRTPASSAARCPTRAASGSSGRPRTAGRDGRRTSRRPYGGCCPSRPGTSPAS